MKRLFCFGILFICLIMCGTLAEKSGSKSQINQICADNEVLKALKQSYDSIDPLVNGTFVVSQNGMFGLTDGNGDLLLPCIYDSVQSEGGGYKIEKDNMYGFADQTGSVIVRPIYHELEIGDDSIVVALYGPDGGAGIMDMQGNVIVPLMYGDASPFEGAWARITKMASGKMNYINRQGEFLLEEDADQCSFFDGGYAFVRYEDDYCFVSGQDTLVRKVKWKPIDYLGADDLFLVRENDMYYMYHAGTDQYDPIAGLSVDAAGFCEDVIGVRNSEGKWGYADKELNIVIPCIYDSVQAFSEDRAWVARDGIYYLISKSDTCYYQGSLLSASPFSEAVSAVKTENGWGFIDCSGQFVLAPCLESAEDTLQFHAGYCDLMWSDPYAAVYINHHFDRVIEYDIWDSVFLQRDCRQRKTEGLDIPQRQGVSVQQQEISADA